MQNLNFYNLDLNSKIKVDYAFYGFSKSIIYKRLTNQIRQYGLNQSGFFILEHFFVPANEYIGTNQVIEY